MTACNHKNLVLLPGAKRRLKCRYCHLTLMPDEREGGYCPECYETSGQKHYDFETIETPEGGKIRYRCEDCNAIIEYG